MLKDTIVLSTNVGETDLPSVSLVNTDSGSSTRRHLFDDGQSKLELTISQTSSVDKNKITSIRQLVRIDISNAADATSPGATGSAYLVTVFPLGTTVTKESQYEALWGLIQFLFTPEQILADASDSTLHNVTKANLVAVQDRLLTGEL